MFFRFLFKLSARFAYAGLIVNVGKALTRSFSGMAHDGCAYRERQQGPGGAASAADAPTRALLSLVSLGGCVKGAFPSRVYLPPSHKVFFHLNF